MQEMLGMEKNKRILVAVIIGSIVVALIGAYLLLFNNPKQVFLSTVNKINNSTLEFVTDNLSTIELYNQDFISNIDLEYYIERDAIREEKNVVVNEETGEETIVINKVPYTQVLSNKFNAYLNRSKKNSHDIVKLTLPSENQESTIYNIYYQGGTLTLDASQYDQFIKLNNDVLKFGNATPNTLDKIVTMYKRIYKQLIKQFKDSDFYKITVEEDVGNGLETVHKYGISIDDERFKQIIINTLQSLSKDQEFITTYIAYQKQVDINSAIDKSAVRTMINGWIEEVSGQEIIENKIYEMVITTTGIFNQNINKIEMFELESNNILKSINVQINGQTANIEIQDNASTVYNIVVTKTEGGYSINIQNNECNINVSFNNYLVSKEIIVSGNIQDKKLTGKYLMKRSADDKQVNNQLNISLNNGQKDVVYIKLENKTKFETVTEYVATKRLYSIDELDIQVKQYVDKFKADVTDKLGIEL